MAHILFRLENTACGPAVARAPAGAPWPQPSPALLSVKVFRWALKVKASRHPCNFLQGVIRCWSHSLNILRSSLALALEGRTGSLVRCTHISFHQEPSFIAMCHYSEVETLVLTL